MTTSPPSQVSTAPHSSPIEREPKLDIQLPWCRGKLAWRPTQVWPHWGHWGNLQGSTTGDQIDTEKEGRPALRTWSTAFLFTGAPEQRSQAMALHIHRAEQVSPPGQEAQFVVLHDLSQSAVYTSPGAHSKALPSQERKFTALSNCEYSLKFLQTRNPSQKTKIVIELIMQPPQLSSQASSTAQLLSTASRRK